MVHFQEDIFRSFRYMIFPETRVPWSHPVEPDASAAVVNPVPPDISVNSCMELYPANLGTENCLLSRYCNIVILNPAECGNPYFRRCLSARSWKWSCSLHMRSDILFFPTVTEHPEKAPQCNGCYHPCYIFRISAPDIMPCASLFAKSIPEHLESWMMFILDYPSFVPMRCDHSNLLGSRCSPLGGGLTDAESAYCYIVKSWFIRIKRTVLLVLISTSSLFGLNLWKLAQMVVLLLLLSQYQV